MLGAGVSLAAVVLAGTLWVHGVRGAGRGWRRAVFLLAFAAPMVWLGVGLTDFARSFVDGFNEGRRDGQAMAIQDRAAEGRPPKPPRPLPVNPIPKTNPYSELLSWVVLTVLLALVLDRLERRQAEAERQTGLAKEAQYRALGARLAPHFIFNTLNTLHAQIEADPKGAQATTERLADLFRQVTTVVAQPLIPLRQELAFVEAYLGIEQARFGSRLRVVLAVPEALEAILIPPLSLQVLVENAVKHGVAAREQGGEIRIFADRLGDGTVQIGVDDPGDGSSGNGSLPGTGTALDTLRQRLEKPEDLEMGMADGRHRVSFRWRLA
jgi:hypothetical protein